MMGASQDCPRLHGATASKQRCSTDQSVAPEVQAILTDAAGVLRSLHGNVGGLSPAAIALRTGLPRSTVGSLLVALELEGFVERSSSSCRVRLGASLLRLAAAAGDIDAVPRRDA